MTKKKFMAMVSDAYGDPFPVDREQALENDIGDGLATFLYLELDENLDDKRVDLDEAEVLINRALTDLERVLQRIQFVNENTKARLRGDKN